MKPKPPTPTPDSSRAEVDAWIIWHIAKAERWLKSLPWWRRMWLEFKWFHVDPIVCRIRCWWTGESCPWE